MSDDDVVALVIDNGSSMCAQPLSSSSDLTVSIHRYVQGGFRR